MSVSYVGRGTFGKVYMYQSSAFKVSTLIKKKESSKGEKHIIVDNVLREAVFYKYVETARAHTSSSSSNLTSDMFLPLPPESIPTTNVFLDEASQIVIKMPYYGKTLDTFRGMLLKVTIATVFKQLLQACEWLHQRQWSHGDIKPTNILFNDKTGKAYLVDYSSIMFSSAVSSGYQRCTQYYVSPEEITHLQSSPACDIWSLGVTLFEVYTKHTFITKLMEYMKVSSETVKRFRLQGDTSKLILINFYSSLQFSNLLAFLQHYVKDREVLSVLCHCLLLNPKDRSSAAWLMKNESLFTDLMSVDEYESEFDVGRLIQANANLQDQFDTYDSCSYANIDKNDREHIVSKMVEVCTCKKDLTEEVFCHSLMLFDRFCFRNMDQPQPSHIFAVVLVVCIFISGMLLKGTYCSIEEIASMISHPDVNPTFVKHMFIKLVKAFDLKLFNMSPDLLYYLSTGTKGLNDDQGKRIGQEAIKYPWLHSNVAKLCIDVFNLSVLKTDVSFLTSEVQTVSKSNAG